MLRLLVSVFALLFMSYEARAETWTFQGIVLTPSQSWEYSASCAAGCLEEPKVFQQQTCLVVASPCLAMLYSGGWDNAAVGYAETADTSGKTGWRKYANNPIIGQGKAGAPNAFNKSFTVSGGICYVFYSYALDLWMTHSVGADCVTGLAAPLRVLQHGTTDIILANTFPWVDGNGNWWIIYESYTASGWQLFLAGGPSPTQLSKMDNNQPLSDFALASSGPFSFKVGDMRQFFTHNGYVSGGQFYSDIYRWCALGGVHSVNNAQPVIVHRPGVFQEADPWGVDLQGVGTIFSDEVNNSPPYAQISLWTTTGALSSLSCP